MGPFLAVVALPRINKLRVINTLNSSTPAASTNYLNLLSVAYWHILISYNNFLRRQSLRQTSLP